MPRSRNGEATARDTLLAIQERRKMKNNSETTGKQATPPPSPGLNQKKNQRLPRTKRPPQLSHRPPEKQHLCHHPKVLR